MNSTKTIITLLVSTLSLAAVAFPQRVDAGDYVYGGGHGDSNKQNVPKGGDTFTDTRVSNGHVTTYDYDTDTGRYIRQIPPGDPLHLRFVPVGESGEYHVYRYFPPKPAVGQPGDPNYEPPQPGYEQLNPGGTIVPS